MMVSCRGEYNECIGLSFSEPKCVVVTTLKPRMFMSRSKRYHYSFRNVIVLLCSLILCMLQGIVIDRNSNTKWNPTNAFVNAIETTSYDCIEDESSVDDNYIHQLYDQSVKIDNADNIRVTEGIPDGDTVKNEALTVDTKISLIHSETTSIDGSERYRNNNVQERIQDNKHLKPKITKNIFKYDDNFHLDDDKENEQYTHSFSSLSELQNRIDVQKDHTTTKQITLFISILFDDGSDGECSSNDNVQNEHHANYTNDLIKATEYVSRKIRSLQKHVHLQNTVRTENHQYYERYNHPLVIFAKTGISRNVRQDNSYEEGNDEMNNDKAFLNQNFYIKKLPQIVLVLVTGRSDRSTTSSSSSTNTAQTTEHEGDEVLLEFYDGVTTLNVHLMFQSILRWYYYHTYLSHSFLTVVEATTGKEGVDNQSDNNADSSNKPDNHHENTDQNNNNDNNNNQKTTVRVNNDVHYLPTIFDSIAEMQSFLYIHRHALQMLLLPENTSTRQTLPQLLPIVERMYIEHLLGWDRINYNNDGYKIFNGDKGKYLNSSSTETKDDDVDDHGWMVDDDIVLTVLVQCRCTDKNNNNNNDDNDDDRVSYTSLNNLFDIMGTLLLKRRDVLFFGVGCEVIDENNNRQCLSSSSLPIEHGAVLVYKIPIQSFNDEDIVRHDADHNWLSRFENNESMFFPSDCYKHYYRTNDNTVLQNITQPLHFHHNFDKYANEYVRTRFHEFLVKVTSPTILWFHRESTGPIAFANGRMVHAVLVVNMHHPTIQKLMMMYDDDDDDDEEEDSTTGNNRFSNENVGNVEENEFDIDDDDNAAIEHYLSMSLRNDPTTQRMRIAVQAFHDVCKKHNTNKFMSASVYNNSRSSGCTNDHNSLPPVNDNRCNNAVMDYDMVCMVVPSTETRILTTFGIDYWTHMDNAASGKMDRHEALTKTNTMFPTLFITDQRSNIGTKRYYLELGEYIPNTTSDDSNSSRNTHFDTEDDAIQTIVHHKIESYITDFWDGKLIPELKSDPRGDIVNKYGVHFLTAATAKKELFISFQEGDGFDDIDNNSNNKNLIKLLLLVSPTCGHCKRISALYNQLSKFIRYIKWENIIKLYRIDITSNDVETALDLTTQWLPDLFYVIPQPPQSNVNNCSSAQKQYTTHKRFIRYTNPHFSSNSSSSKNTNDVEEENEHYYHVDHGGEDGIGSISDFTQILNWLLLYVLDDEVGFDNDSISELYSNLQEFSK